jgi:hypothetical protein
MRLCGITFSDAERDPAVEAAYIKEIPEVMLKIQANAAAKQHRDETRMLRRWRLGRFLRGCLILLVLHRLTHCNCLGNRLGNCRKLCPRRANR